jgi:FkbM family methyltransferase
MIENFVKSINIDKNYEYIIFDIGSRDCQQSIEFYNTFPNAKIYAFECNPNTLNICKENIRPYNDRITLIEGAVCDYNGTIKFYPIDKNKTVTTWADGNPGASSIFQSNGNYPAEKYVQYEISTNCHRLDSVMSNMRIPRVDIIWMDLQGAELLALKGLGNHLQRVKYIYTEVIHIEMYTGQVLFNELNRFILSNGFGIKNNLSMSGWHEDVIYERIAGANNEGDDSMGKFDIVIPVGPYDKDVIETQIGYTKKNIIGYRNIYLVSYDASIIVNGCITIDEKIFPFNIDTVIQFHGKLDRNGWYLQQLLKLYAGKVIPNILDRYLVIDSDTFFLKPTTFIEDNTCLYNYGFEYWTPYFIHMGKLDSRLTKVLNVSGICHHMMFETKYVNEIIDMIEKNYNDTFYNVFLSMVTDTTGSGASEYEIYFNYMLKYHSDKIKIRELNWRNTSGLILDDDFDYVSSHHHLRGGK